MADSAEITVLKFPENVRKRKEMYLIDPNHCIYEIIDNAVDEFNAGRAKHISFSVEQNGEMFPTINIFDDGGGIPTSLSKDPEHITETQAEVALGNLTAGGKFGTEGGYKTITSGLHGVGASCVNATSKSFTATIYHNKTVTTLKYEKGILIEKKINKPYKDDKHGTLISFVLDDELWKGEEFNFDVIKRRLKQLSYLNPGLEITYSPDHHIIETFIHTNGLEEYYRDLTRAKSMLNSDPILINKTIKNEEVGDIGISLALGYSSGYSSDIYGFVNNVSTASGDHYIGLTQGVSRAVALFYGENDKYKNLMKNLTSEDCKEGIVALLSVRVMYPKFEGQSKASIKMPQVRSAIYNIVVDELKLFLEQHPTFVKDLGGKLEKAAKSRIAAKRARDAIRSAKSTIANDSPEKLAACSSKKPEECSLYIVEGER